MEAKAYQTFASTLRGTSSSGRFSRESTKRGQEPVVVVNKSQPMFEGARLESALTRPVVPGVRRGRTVMGTVSRRDKFFHESNVRFPAHSGGYEDQTEYDAQYASFPRRTTSRVEPSTQPDNYVPTPEPLPASVQVHFSRVRRAVDAPWAKARTSNWSSESTEHGKRSQSARVQHALRVLSGGLGDLNSREWFKSSGLRFDTHPVLTRDDVAGVVEKYALQLDADEMSVVLDTVVGRIVGDRMPKAEFMDVTYRLKADNSASQKANGFLGFYKQTRAQLEAGDADSKQLLDSLSDAQLYEQAVSMHGVPSVCSNGKKHKLKAERAKALLSTFFAGKSRASLQKLGVGRYVDKEQQNELLLALNIETDSSELDRLHTDQVADSDQLRSEITATQARSRAGSMRADSRRGTAGEIVFGQQAPPQDTGEGKVLTSLFFARSPTPEHHPLYQHSMPTTRIENEPDQYQTVERLFYSAATPGSNRRVFPPVSINPVREDAPLREVEGTTNKEKAKNNLLAYMHSVKQDELLQDQSNHHNAQPVAREMMMKYRYNDTRGIIGHDVDNHHTSTNTSSSIVSYKPTNNRDHDIALMQQQDKERKKALLQRKTTQRQQMDLAHVSQQEAQQQQQQLQQEQQHLRKMIKQLHVQHKIFCGSNAESTMALQ